MVSVRCAEKRSYMANNTEFINAHRSKTIDFKPRTGSKTKGLPVGKYLIVTNGRNGNFSIYNASVGTLLFKTDFESIFDAYEFCQKLRKIYKHLLVILSDPRYSENFFLITRYTVPNGEELYEHIRSFDDLSVIRRSDLDFILDK